MSQLPLRRPYLKQTPPATRCSGEHRGTPIPGPSRKCLPVEPSFRPHVTVLKSCGSCGRVGPTTPKSMDPKLLRSIRPKQANTPRWHHRRRARGDGAQRAQFPTGIGPGPGYGFWARPKFGPTGSSRLSRGTWQAVNSSCVRVSGSVAIAEAGPAGAGRVGLRTGQPSRCRVALRRDQHGI